MTALEINLVSPAGPHKLGGGLNLANRPSGPQCASLLFKCNHWKRKLKADLSWMSYNSSIQTRTQTYLKGAFISTRATKLVCFGDFIMNSGAHGQGTPYLHLLICWWWCQNTHTDLILRDTLSVLYSAAAEAKKTFAHTLQKGWQTSGLKAVVGGYLQMVHHNFLPSQQQGVWQCCIVRCIMMRSAILVQLRKLHNDANCSPRTPVALRLWKVCRLQFAPFAQLFAAVRVSINVSGTSLLDELFHKPKIESSKYRTKIR